MKVVRAALGLVFLASTACSPLVRFEGRVTVEGVETLDPDRLFLSLRVLDQSSAARPPRTFEISSSNPNQIRREGDALIYGESLDGFEYVVEIQFWYDVDGDGNIGPGDRAGRLPAPVVTRDRGLFSGNMTTIDPVHLVAPADPDAWGQWPAEP